METISLLWIDEAGDCGFKFDRGSSRFFVVVGVYITNGQKEEVESMIYGLRATLSVPADFEFKFSRNKHLYRETFFNALALFPIQYKAVVVDKQEVAAPALKSHPRQLYCESVRRLLYDNIPPLIDAVLVIDEASAKIHRKEFNAVLKQYVSKNIVRKIRQLRSGSDAMIQIADMMAGSIFREYERGDPRYHEIIK